MRLPNRDVRERQTFSTQWRGKAMADFRAAAAELLKSHDDFLCAAKMDVESVERSHPHSRPLLSPLQEALKHPVLKTALL
jgi:hypothetical protein